MQRFRYVEVALRSALALEENSCIMFQNILMARKERPPMPASVVTMLGMCRTASATTISISTRMLLVIKVVLRGADGLHLYVNDWTLRQTAILSKLDNA